MLDLRPQDDAPPAPQSLFLYRVGPYRRDTVLYQRLLTILQDLSAE